MFQTLLAFIFPELIDESILRVFGYTTVRAGCALAFAFTVSLVLGPMCIRRLTALKAGQQVRQFQTAETQQFNIHQHKAGTPTMGGLLIIVATLSSVLLFCDPTNSYVWLVVVVMLGAGALGFSDDYLKIAKKDHRGVSARWKLIVQVGLGCALGAFLLCSPSHTNYALAGGTEGIRGDTHVLVPFLKNVYPALGIGFLLWVALVLTATSNAVNLTDGLDGLAIGTVITVSLPYILITYLVSRYDYAGYLNIPHVPQAAELGVFLSAMLGAALGFLWFNSHPAEMFMGDTGSLSLGAAIGAIAVLCKHEVLLVLIGGIFVIEGASVIVQVLSYKWRGKRVLLMSPLHNHFVKKGTDEAKIIARFLIVATLLALAGLSTLKLR